ncbi:MAG: hypothetical protein ACRDPE_17460 [Solirubrobacterales bacterium]
MTKWRNGGVMLAVALMALDALAAVASAAQLVDDEGDNALVGTSGPDYILGHQGNDLLHEDAAEDVAP